MRRLFAASLCLACSAALARAADADGVVYSDDFATLRSGWGTADGVQSVADNKLLLNPKPDTIYASLYTDRSFADADIRVKVSQTKGDLASPFGLAFWGVDYSNYYVARIRSNGVCWVGRKMGGKWLSPVYSEEKPAVRKGLGETNELRVVTRGRLATVYVNGQQIAEFRGYPPTEPGKIGVYAESGPEQITWAASELTVRELPAQPAARSASDESLLVADDFTSYDPAWGNPDKFWKAASGRMTVTLDPQLNSRALYSGSFFSDVDARVKVSQSQGDLNQPAGLIFWAVDTGNYAVFMMQSDGTLFVGRRADKKWTLNSLSGGKDFKQGLGRAHELRVVTNGNKAKLYCDGREIATYTGFPPEGGGRVGLHAESGEHPATWAYSAFEVRKP